MTSNAWSIIAAIQVTPKKAATTPKKEISHPLRIIATRIPQAIAHPPQGLLSASSQIMFSIFMRKVIARALPKQSAIA